MLDAIEIEAHSQKIAVLEGHPTTLWCSGNQEYSDCIWSLPRGESCSVGPGKAKCVVENSVSFTGNTKNCSITIDRVQADENGDWKCTLTDASGQAAIQTQRLTVAQKAKADFVDLVGVVTGMVGQPEKLQCEARHGRPIGEFKWRIGESEGDPQPAVYMENNNKPRVEEDQQGFYTVTETLLYDPKQEHNERNLYCIYIQKDSNGNQFFSDESHVSLSIYYLEDPVEELKTLQPAKIGENVEVTFEFGAAPKPEARDVVWVIRKDSKTVEVVTETDNDAVKDHYLAKPIETVRENRYMATLTIQNVQQDEENYSHMLRISNRDKTSGDLFSSVEHKFKVNVDTGDRSSGYQDEGDGTEEPDGGSATAIIVSVVVILIIALLIGGAVFYAKRKQMWCFKPQENPTKPTTVDPEAHAPLNQDEPPIIRGGYRRPD